jgi:DNA-binding MarR family transcriptional regulator
VKPDDRLIYLVALAHRTLIKEINRRLKQAGLEVSGVQIVILFLLKGRDGQPMSRLGRALGTDNSTVTRLVDRMERSGHVARRQSPTDRRVSQVWLTDRGMQAREEAKVVVRAFNDEIRQTMSAAELATFKVVLTRLADVFGSCAPASGGREGEGRR